MKIGIDISQIVYEGTGVAKYVRELVRAMLIADTKNEYVLFAGSLRRTAKIKEYFDSLTPLNSHIRLITVPFSPRMLDLLWNRLHVVPIQWFIGHIDIFWSSDWTQPPLAGAYGITTIHDLSIFRYPESFASEIVRAHTKRLARAVRECKTFICDSEATKQDALSLLKVPSSRVRVIYPGFHI